MAVRTALFLNQFRRDERGAVAIIFGLTAMVMTMLAGFALDYSRVLTEYTRISAAVDAAALASGKAMIDGRMTDADVREIANTYFQKNLENSGQGYGKLTSFEVTLDRATSGVSIDAKVEVEMTLARIAGIDSMEFPMHASTKVDPTDVEISLALDVTGSMAPTGKIDALRRASTNLVDTLLKDEGRPNKVRVALAPYSSGVNAGDYVAAVTGSSASPCTFEREAGDDTSMSVPEAGTFLKTNGSTGIASRATCPGARIIPLTDDKSTLMSEIATYTAGGSTAGHLGALWATYMLQDTWGRVFAGHEPGAFDGRTKKYMVLMTDGLFNTIGGSNSGDSSPAATRSQQIAMDTCAAARAQGITVYTVGFKLDEIRDRRLRDRAEATLRTCSGNVSSQHFDAANEEQLVTAFDTIAEQIINLRLTN